LAFSKFVFYEISASSTIDTKSGNGLIQAETNFFSLVEN